MSSTRPFGSSSSRSMHAELVDLGIKLGYFNNSEGACAGITMAWLSACLTDEKQVAKYLRFTKEITVAGPKLFDRIRAMQAKISKKDTLTDEDKELFQYLAFYEQIALYLNPYKYNTLFGQYLNQGDIEELSSFANSASLEEKGGLSVVYSESSIYTNDELKAYLTEIAKSVTPGAGTIALSLASYNHAIGLTYNPNNRSWQLMNINEGEPQTLGIDKIVYKVLDGFNIAPKHTPRHLYTAFCTKVITADEPLKREALRTSLQQLKIKHPVSRELAARIGAVNVLWMAAKNGDLSVTQACLNQGSDVNQATTDGTNITPLYMAAQNGYIDVVQALLANDANVNKAATDGTNPLYMAAQQGHIAIVQALLAKGANINQGIVNAATPLYVAAQCGQVVVVQELLVKGADVNKATKTGITPLYMAAKNGHIDVVKVLLANGAKVNQGRADGVTPLCIATEQGHIDVVRELLAKSADVNQAMADGTTPLCIAVQKGSIDIVRELFNKNAEVNKAMNSGDTPLCIAAQNGSIDIVRELLDKGADVNKATTTGITPLYIAAKNGHIDVVMTLLAHGAKVNQAKTNGVTPLDIATKMGHVDVMRALQTACDKPTASEDFKTKLETIKPAATSEKNSSKPTP